MNHSSYNLYSLNCTKGNVLNVVSDCRILIHNCTTSSANNNVLYGVSFSNYYAFGMQLPERHESVGDSYRYGYQGSECDSEIKGEGNNYTTEFRQLDPRLGRWMSIDPQMASLPWQSPYCSMDNNPVKWNDIKGDVTPKEEKKLAKEQKKLHKEFDRIAKNEKKWAKNEIRRNGGVLKENIIKIDENDETTSYSVGRDYGVVVNSKLSKERSNSMKSYRSNTNKLEGYWYSEGEIMGISISVGYDAYVGGGISGSADYLMMGGETVLGGTFGGGIGFGGGAGVDVGYIKCSQSGRYRAKDIQEGDGWEFSAGIGPLEYSRSGDRTSSAFYWNGETNQTSSFDIISATEKSNWIALYQAIGMKTLNSLKARGGIKYEWNQSNVWKNY